MDKLKRFAVGYDKESDSCELVIFPKDLCNDMYLDGGIGIELSKEERIELIELLVSDYNEHCEIKEVISKYNKTDQYELIEAISEYDKELEQGIDND